MQKLDIAPTATFSELDLLQFDTLRFSVYVIDKNWSYLFVNKFAKQNLSERGADLIGKNMWENFRELAMDPSFQRMKSDIENGKNVNLITTSPINNQRLNIVGYCLRDCYFFYASLLPRKDELMSELRAALEKR